MRSFCPWPLFPSDLKRSVARSLSLQFALKELLKSFALVDARSQPEQFLALSLIDPFVQKGGALDRLCFYSEILLQNSTRKPLQVLEDLRNLILQELALSWKERLEQIGLGLKRFFEALQLPLYESRSDESVLVFLMENKQKINHYLGASTLENLFGVFFPEGPDQLRAVLFEGFSKRGFSLFFKKIEPLIDTSFHEGP